MENELLMDEDYSLWLLLAQARHAMIRARQEELARYNIPIRQVAVFSAIEAIGHNATPANISRMLFRKSHSVSELLGRMKKKGLLRKIRGKRNNRVRVVLTEKGREAYTQSLKRESIYKIMSCLSEEEKRLLRSCLLNLRDKALKELGLERDIPLWPSPHLRTH